MTDEHKMRSDGVRVHLSLEADELRVAHVVRVVLPEAPLERVELDVVDLELVGAVLGLRLLLRQADRAVLERREHRRGHQVVLGLRAAHRASQRPKQAFQICKEHERYEYEYVFYSYTVSKF